MPTEEEWGKIASLKRQLAPYLRQSCGQIQGNAIDNDEVHKDLSTCLQIIDDQEPSSGEATTEFENFRRTIRVIMAMLRSDDLENARQRCRILIKNTSSFT